ncbi:MAG: hypothetical protein Q8R36_03670 [bacterium]|nr:hypothetical protein [bacterium]
MRYRPETNEFCPTSTCSYKQIGNLSDLLGYGSTSTLPDRSGSGSPEEQMTHLPPTPFQMWMTVLCVAVIFIGLIFSAIYTIL